MEAIPILILLVLSDLGRCAPIDTEADEPFEIDFSHLGEEVYERRRPNQSEKTLDLWLFDDDILNAEEMGSYVEGDIYQPFVPKNALKFRSKRWKNAVVPYEISDDFNFSDVQKIKTAFQIFKQKTCVRFVPREENHRDFIAIEGSWNGCWSTVGRAGGKQILNLQSGACLRHTGTILHELMHVLGFFHEHTRHDRDKFVSVNFQNVRTDSTSNFKKERQDRTTTHGIGYDLGSVMHYSPTAFSWNGNPTIEPKVKFSGKVGQRNGFSSKDIQSIKAMYC